MHIYFLGFLLLVTGCAIREEVKPIEHVDFREVCIIEDPAVREGFLQEYRRDLQGLGYQVRILPQQSKLTACPITSTYLARWSWDWFWTAGVYMTFAEIKVYGQGELLGSARYDSTDAAANPSRIIDAEPKIKELVSELFPPLSSATVGGAQTQ